MLIYSLHALLCLVNHSNFEGFLNYVKIMNFVPDDSVVRSSSMPPLPSSGSSTPGKRLTRSTTDGRRKSTNDDDDPSIRYVGEPRLSNRRKVPASSTSSCCSFNLQCVVC